MPASPLRYALNYRLCTHRHPLKAITTPDPNPCTQPASLPLADSCARSPPVALRDLLARIPLPHACPSSPPTAVQAPPVRSSFASRRPSAMPPASLRPFVPAQIPRAPVPAQCALLGSGLTALLALVPFPLLLITFVQTGLRTLCLRVKCDRCWHRPHSETTGWVTVSVQPCARD